MHSTVELDKAIRSRYTALLTGEISPTYPVQIDRRDPSSYTKALFEEACRIELGHSNFKVVGTLGGEFIWVLTGE